MNQQINFDVVQLRYLDALEIKSVDWMSIVMLLFGPLLNRRPMLGAVFDVFLKSIHTKINVFPLKNVNKKSRENNERKNILLAVRSIIMPHQMDQPHPTRQNINVNACATPTNIFTKNDPMRARTLSC